MKVVWKGSAEVRRLLFSKSRGKLIRIGGRHRGDIYIGRVVFEDGKRHRVAIKRFKIPLNDDRARRYQKVINELKEVGVRLPKMAMIKTNEGEWVQVSQL